MKTHAGQAVARLSLQPTAGARHISLGIKAAANELPDGEYDLFAGAAPAVSALANSKTEAAPDLPIKDVNTICRWASQIERIASQFNDERVLLCHQAAILLHRIAFVPATPAAPIDVAESVGEPVLLLNQTLTVESCERLTEFTTQVRAHVAAQVAKASLPTYAVNGEVLSALEYIDHLHSQSAAAPATPNLNRAELIERIVLSVAEIPDRDSPEDQPEMMLVKASELRGIIASAFEVEDEAAPQATQPEAAPKPNADCSGDPSCCPDNEGYGCACSPAVVAQDADARNAALEEAARCMVERAGQHFTVGHMAEQDECIRCADSIRSLKTQAQPAPSELTRLEGLLFRIDRVLANADECRSDREIIVAISILIASFLKEAS
jgi:hypothetical protein